jgi:hypothetical protein
MTAPGSLTLAQLRAILAELAAAGGDGDGSTPSVAAVRGVLSRHDRAELPFDVVSTLVDAVSGPGAVRPVSSLPLKRLEELMDRIGEAAPVPAGPTGGQ